MTSARGLILVVDDSLTVRKQLSKALEGAGFAVHEAENGEEGVKRARENAYNLIFADVNMPVMDGIAMLTEVRKLPSHAKTPIFVLTTESTTDYVARGKSAGATAWIVKPFQPETVLKGVEKVLASR